VFRARGVVARLADEPLPVARIGRSSVAMSVAIAAPLRVRVTHGAALIVRVAIACSRPASCSPARQRIEHMFDIMMLWW
jgi:hypothetical protein